MGCNTQQWRRGPQRNNPGGLLNVAIEITEFFLEEGKMIVSTKGRRPSQNTETLSTNTDHVNDVLTQLGANIAEFFSGNLLEVVRRINSLQKRAGDSSRPRGRHNLKSIA